MVMTQQLIRFFAKWLGPWSEAQDKIFLFLVDIPCSRAPWSFIGPTCELLLSRIRYVVICHDKLMPLTRLNFVSETPGVFNFSDHSSSNESDDDSGSILTVIRSGSMEAVIPSDVSVPPHRPNEIDRPVGRRSTRGQRKRRRTRFSAKGR
jgi:hypothetical protein